MNIDEKTLLFKTLLKITELLTRIEYNTSGRD